MDTDLSNKYVSKNIPLNFRDFYTVMLSIPVYIAYKYRVCIVQRCR